MAFSRRESLALFLAWRKQISGLHLKWRKLKPFWMSSAGEDYGQALRPEADAEELQLVLSATRPGFEVGPDAPLTHWSSVFFLQKTQPRWPNAFSAPTPLWGGGFGSVVAGEARLAAIARVGRTAPPPAPLSATDCVQHFRRTVAPVGALMCMCREAVAFTVRGRASYRPILAPDRL